MLLYAKRLKLKKPKIVKLEKSQNPANAEEQGLLYKKIQPEVKE
jgi:hypothetical protein